MEKGGRAIKSSLLSLVLPRGSRCVVGVSAVAISPQQTFIARTNSYNPTRPSIFSQLHFGFNGYVEGKTSSETFSFLPSSSYLLPSRLGNGIIDSLLVRPSLKRFFYRCRSPPFLRCPDIPYSLNCSEGIPFSLLAPGFCERERGGGTKGALRPSNSEREWP